MATYLLALLGLDLSLADTVSGQAIPRRVSVLGRTAIIDAGPFSGLTVLVAEAVRRQES